MIYYWFQHIEETAFYTTAVWLTSVIYISLYVCYLNVYTHNIHNNVAIPLISIMTQWLKILICWSSLYETSTDLTQPDAERIVLYEQQIAGKIYVKSHSMVLFSFLKGKWS